MTPEYEVFFVDGTTETVKAYNVDFHETHIAFSNTTLVKAYRSETVDKIERVI